MQGPKGSFARLVRGPWDFDKAVVEAEGVTDGVLPTLLVLTVKGKQVHDELKENSKS